MCVCVLLDQLNIRLDLADHNLGMQLLKLAGWPANKRLIMRAGHATGSCLYSAVQRMPEIVCVCVCGDGDDLISLLLLYWMQFTQPRTHFTPLRDSFLSIPEAAATTTSGL